MEGKTGTSDNPCQCRPSFPRAPQQSRQQSSRRW